MPYVIVLAEKKGRILKKTARSRFRPSYLKAYDPEAYDGMGEATSTFDLAEAARFATFSDALACYRTVPANRPTRPDGRPNRPLTAFTVAFREVSEEGEESATARIGAL